MKYCKSRETGLMFAYTKAREAQPEFWEVVEVDAPAKKAEPKAVAPKEAPKPAPKVPAPKAAPKAKKAPKPAEPAVAAGIAVTDVSDGPLSEDAIDDLLGELDGTNS